VFTRIIVGYNDSPRAARALAAAVRLAVETDRPELIAVAVQRSLLLSGDSLGEVRDAQAAGDRACAAWLSSALGYADKHDVGLRTEIRFGPLARQLADAVAEHRADLLVVGCSRHPAARRLYRAGLADQLSRRCRCPIMTVP
jgi:nucleotide-binding universal stress UspA family protein